MKHPFVKAIGFVFGGWRRAESILQASVTEVSEKEDKIRWAMGFAVPMRWVLPMRGCADAGGMEEVTLFKRKVSDRSTVTPSR